LIILYHSGPIWAFFIIFGHFVPLGANLGHFDYF
jgi:hypothetical protein